MLKELNEKNFYDEIKTGLKLVEFYTSWCGYCKKQEPELNEMDKIWIGKINAEKESQISKKYNISAYPTFLIFKNGEEVSRISGFHKKENLMNIILSYLN